MKKHILIIASIISLIILSGCGGGQSNDKASTDTLDAVFKAGIKEVGITDVEVASIEASNTDGSGLLSIGNALGAFGSLDVGDVVALAPSASQGLPYGYTGVVVEKADGSVVLRDAALNEVFESISWNQDTLRSFQVAEVIGVGGVKAKLVASSKNWFDRLTNLIMPNAVASNNRLTGDIETTSSGLINASVSIEFPLSSGSKLTGTVYLESFREQSTFDYSLLKYLSTFGINEVYKEISGKLGLKLTLDPVSSEDVASLSWADAFPKLGGGDYTWDKPSTTQVMDEHWYSGDAKYFKLSGLDKSDRSGLIPLFGLVVIPQFPATVFVNSPSVYAGSTPLALIFWVYMDVDGSLKIKGSNSIVDANSGSWRIGAGVERAADSGQLKAKSVRDFGSLTIASKFGVAATLSQQLGTVVAADLIVAGIRPVTTKLEVIGARFQAKVQDLNGVQVSWYPDLDFTKSALEPEICANYQVATFSEASFKFRVEATTNIPGVDDVVLHGENKYTKNWSDIGDIYGENCPIKNTLTVTKVEEEAPIQSTCGSGADAHDCSLFCQSDVNEGDVFAYDGNFSVNRLDLSTFPASIKKPGAWQIDSDDSVVRFDGVYGLRDASPSMLGTFSAEKTLAPTYSYFPQLTYTGTKSLATALDINRAQAKFSGIFTTTQTNGWSVDARTVTCKNTFSVASEVDWLIK